MFHRHYLFLKSDANRFRTGAGYFRIRVQRYEKILIYANLGAGKWKKTEKWPMIQSLEMDGDGMSDSIRRNGHRKMSHIMRPNGQ